MTVPPACCPTWSRAPSPLFIPPSPFSHSLIPINLISPVPSPSLRSHFQSYLSNPPTSIFLPSPAFHLASLTPTPPQGLPKAWAFRYEIQCPARKPKSQESFGSYTMDRNISFYTCFLHPASVSPHKANGAAWEIQ